VLGEYESGSKALPFTPFPDIYHPITHRYVALVAATFVTLQTKIKDWGEDYDVFENCPEFVWGD